jgi:crotonobetainyl-CoA:carnitine CoA-transferase CaiB-like acyl-CoA transferase
VGRAAGNHHASISPYGLFRCADGAVQIAVGSEALWRRFCAGFDIDPERPDIATNPDRVRRKDEVIELVEGVFAAWKSAELLERLAELGIPAGKVRSVDEVYAWEQTLSQGLVIDVEHPTLGRLRLPGPPLRFFEPDGEERTRVDHRPPPVLGGDADAVRALAGDATA